MTDERTRDGCCRRAIHACPFSNSLFVNFRRARPGIPLQPGKRDCSIDVPKKKTAGEMFGGRALSSRGAEACARSAANGRGRPGHKPRGTGAGRHQLTRNACLISYAGAFINSRMSKTPDVPSLAELRKDIDRIDETMHNLLIERSEIIGRLIAVKKSQETGSAFRPAREAEMMRRLVERHKGILPLDTVESIWRVIIATFTYVQSPFSVHADLSAGDALMRDSARFHFGFTVPFVPHMGASGVVQGVSESKGDLGLVPATAVAGAGAWWSALEFDTAPKIIARLPFVERPDHPAALPV